MVTRALFTSKRNCEEKRKGRERMYDIPLYLYVILSRLRRIVAVIPGCMWKNTTPNGREYLDTNAGFTLDVPNMKSLSRSKVLKKKKRRKGNQAIYVLLKLRFLETSLFRTC